MVYVEIKQILLIILVSLFFFSSCQKKVNPLDQALTLAGENKAELEKVLIRFKQNPGDSLKYKAACFLIENMPHYYFFEGEQLDRYQAYYKALHNHKDKRAIEPSAILDSISELYGPFNRNGLNVKHDILEIDSAYLCNNIEWSFKVWEEQPWGKNVSFEDFCEYILPYRIGDEKLTYWRQELYEKYNHFLEPLMDTTFVDRDDPLTAVKILMDSIAKRDSVYFTTTGPPNYPHVGPQIALFKSGSCGELTDYVIYVCRSLGIPCHIDFMPTRGDDNVGHFWVSYKDKAGELYLQDFPDNIRLVRTDGVRWAAKAKVYRHTFSLNRKMQKEITSLDLSVPSFFERPKVVDVTLLYAGYYTQHLKIPESKLYKTGAESKIAYLCLCQNLDWSPIAWTKFEKNNLCFSNIQKGSVMRIATWENKHLVFQSDPFVIDKFSNEITYFSPNDSLQDVVLYAKYKLFEEDFFRDRMIGGVIEASNSIDFNIRDTLYVINESPQRLNTYVNADSNKAYKYLRYYGPAGAHCNISELSFYEHVNDTIPIKGKIVGTPGSYQGDGSHEYTNVFDEKSWTSFDYKDPSGGWAGLELENPVRITRMTYTPRNRDNYIRPGDDFELFYCDHDWISLGRITTTSDSLSYKGVPKGVLLYLKNHNRGIQERIFTYEDKKQQWK